MCSADGWRKAHRSLRYSQQYAYEGSHADIGMVHRAWRGVKVEVLGRMNCWLLAVLAVFARAVQRTSSPMICMSGFSALSFRFLLPRNARRPRWHSNRCCRRRSFRSTITQTRPRQMKKGEIGLLGFAAGAIMSSLCILVNWRSGKYVVDANEGSSSLRRKDETMDSTEGEISNVCRAK